MNSLWEGVCSKWYFCGGCWGSTSWTKVGVFEIFKPEFPVDVEGPSIEFDQCPLFLSLSLSTISDDDFHVFFIF